METILISCKLIEWPVPGGIVFSCHGIIIGWALSPGYGFKNCFYYSCRYIRLRGKKSGSFCFFFFKNISISCKAGQGIHFVLRSEICYVRTDRNSCWAFIPEIHSYAVDGLISKKDARSSNQPKSAYFKPITACSPERGSHLLFNIVPRQD